MTSPLSCTLLTTGASPAAGRIRQLLEPHAVQVEACPNPAAAADHLRWARSDVLVLDAALAVGGDPFPAGPAPPRVPVVILSEAARADAALRLARATGGDVIPLEGLTPPVLAHALERARFRVPSAGPPVHTDPVADRVARGMEQALRDSEESYRALFDGISELVYILDDRGRFLNVNDAVLCAYGYRREELIGQTPALLADQDRTDPSFVPPRLAAALGGEPQRFHWWARRKDGSTFPKEVVLTRGRYFGRDVVIAVARDVSERITAERAIAESEERYRLMVEGSDQVFFFAHDPEHRFTYLSPSVREVLGYPAEELLGQPYDVLLAGSEDDAEVHRLTECALRTGRRSSTYTALTRHRDGRIVAVEVTESPVVHDGTVVGLHGFARDVTDRLRMEQEIRRSEARFAGIVSLASDAIISIDSQGRIALFNRGAERIFGYRPEEVVGRPMGILLPERLRTSHRARVQHFAESGGASRRMGERSEVLGRRKSGEEFPAEATISRLDTGDERLLTVVLRDVTDRKRAEGRLHEAYRRQAAFLDSIPDIAWLRDTEGRFVAVNHAFVEGVGSSGDEVVGRTIEDVFPPGLAEQFRREDERVVQQAHRTTVEERVLHADGVERWYETTRAPIRQDGRIVGLVGIARDVSARRRMEQELRSTYERLQHILAASPTVLYTLALQKGAQPRASWISGNVQEILGWDVTRALAPGWWWSGVHPEDREQAGGWLQTLLHEGRLRHEYRFRHRDGSYRWIRDELTLTGEPGGEQEVVGSWTDITERKEAELAVLRSRDHYHCLLDGLPILVWNADADGVGQYVNRAWLEFTGRTLPEERGDGWTECIHPDDRPRTLESYRAALAVRAPYEMEYRLRHYTGEYRPVLEVGRPLFDAEGAFRGYIGGGIDLHGQRELETQLRQAQKLDAVGRLAGGIAHDFNNLLTAIKGNTALLLEDLAPHDPMREDLGEIAGAADRAAALTQQLLAFSRKQVLQPRILALDEVISSTSGMLRRLISEDIEMTIDLGPGGEVRADRVQLEQVVLNLAINGRDSMPGGGRLTFRTRTLAVGIGEGPQPYVRPGSYAALTVQDTGSGMDENTLGRIFEPFFTTKPKGRGTGLGLSTAYGIVKQSGGYIWAESAPGAGSTFTVLLPLVEADPAA